MITSTSQLGTKHGRDYFREFCALYPERVPVHADVEQALVTLPIGDHELAASEEALAARVQSCAKHIDRVEEVFGEGADFTAGNKAVINLQ